MPKSALPFCFSLIISVLPVSAFAHEISGFQDFQFGMPLSEVEAIQPLTPGSEEDKGRWYQAAETVNILGNEYTQKLLFNGDEVLIQVKGSIYECDPLKRVT